LTQVSIQSYRFWARLCAKNIAESDGYRCGLRSKQSRNK